MPKLCKWRLLSSFARSCNSTHCDNPSLWGMHSKLVKKTLIFLSINFSLVIIFFFDYPSELARDLGYFHLKTLKQLTSNLNPILGQKLGFLNSVLLPLESCIFLPHIPKMHAWYPISAKVLESVRIWISTLGLSLLRSSSSSSKLWKSCEYSSSRLEIHSRVTRFYQCSQSSCLDNGFEIANEAIYV